MSNGYIPIIHCNIQVTSQQSAYGVYGEGAADFLIQESFISARWTDPGLNPVGELCSVYSAQGTVVNDNSKLEPKLDNTKNYTMMEIKDPRPVCRDRIIPWISGDFRKAWKYMYGRWDQKPKESVHTSHMECE